MKQARAPGGRFQCLDICSDAGAYRLTHSHRGFMTILRSIDHAPRTDVADRQARLLDYAGHVDELRSPEEVLNELHAVTTRGLPLLVLGALRLPIKSGDWESI